MREQRNNSPFVFFLLPGLFLLGSCDPQLASNPSPKENQAKTTSSPDTSVSNQDSKPSATSDVFDTPSEGFSDSTQATPKVLNQTSIFGLLVSPLNAADSAGEASRMTATVIAPSPAARLGIQFNQSVGDSMESALKEVIKFHQLRHPGEDAHKSIEISFEEQYSAKDGPSAAVACALLAESIISGVELDQSLAVTGDLNSDGSVQPVGGIEGKVRGAMNEGCATILIPASSATVLSDYAALSELKAFIGAQIFTVETFEETLRLARSSETRDPQVQGSLDTFKQVQEVLQRPDGEKWLRNPHVIEKLRSVLESTPNHASAKYLLLHGLNRSPQSLSLSGSFLQIYKATGPLRDALESGEIPEDTGDLSQAMFDLRKLRSKLDPRTRACADALEDFSGAVKEIGDTNLGTARSRIPKIVERLESSWIVVVREYKKIRNDPQIQEELALE